MKSFDVFRIAKGHDGGVVKSECPIDFHKKEEEIKQKLAQIQ